MRTAMRTLLLKAVLSAALVLGSVASASAARADQYYFEMDFRKGWGTGADFYATGFPSAQMLYNDGSGRVVPFVPDLPAGGDVHVPPTFYSVGFYGNTSAIAGGMVPGTDSTLGFSTTSPIFFAFQHVGFGCPENVGDLHPDGCGHENLDDGDPDHGSATSSLPTATRDGQSTPMGDPHPSVVPQTGGNGSSVFLISVDRSSPDFLRLYPITTDFGQSNFCGDALACGFQKHNKLAITPLQGVPLHPGTLYAAVITDKVTHDGGTPIDVSPGLAELVECVSDASCDASHGATAQNEASGISANAYDEYAQAIRVLQTASGPTYDGPSVFKHIRALTVFETGVPTAGFDAMVADALGNPAVDASIEGAFAPASSRFPKGTTTDFGQDDGAPGAPIAKDGVFGEFCVFEAHVWMPDYQSGKKPFSWPDGAVQFDWLTQKPILQPREPPGRIFVTIPRKPMPAAGYPVVVLERAGAGGDVPLVDRGPQYDHFPVYGWSGGGLETNVDPSCRWGLDDLCETQPGAGPAKWFAMAGWAGVQIDDPLGGARRPPGKSIADEDGLIFDPNDPVAIRDNIRQAALELVVLGAKTLTDPTMTIPRSVVDGAGCTVQTCQYTPDFEHRVNCTDTGTSVLASSGQSAVHFDVSTLTLMGHSVGATIAPLALEASAPASASQPGGPVYKNAILSGAGASFLNNILYKEEPATAIPLTTGRLGLREVAETYPLLDRVIRSEGDPALGVVQWGLEPWDAQVYHAKRITTFARLQHVLQFQGLIDHYIESPISDAAALSAGLAVGLTARMRGDPRWNLGYDDDSGFYNHAGTTWEWEDNPSYSITGMLGAEYDGSYFSSVTHDWRAFEPLSTVVDLGAFARGFNGTAPVVALPQTGKSILVQVDNLASQGDYAPGTTAPFSSFPGVGYEDGHEVMWQHIEPKLQYECFLQSIFLGVSGHMPPIVPDELSATQSTPCCPHSVTLARQGGVVINLPGMAMNCSACVQAVCETNSRCCDTTNPAAWNADCEAVAKTTPQCGPND